jgi:putative ABC transport system permease protein
MMMFKILKLALKNVTRNKRRTIITVLMIAFGILVTIFLSGFLGSIAKDLRLAVIEGETGDIQIMANGYKENRLPGNLDYIIPNSSKLMAEIQSEPGITAVVSRVSVSGLISNGKQSIYCWGSAIEPSTVGKTLPKMLQESTGERRLSLKGEDGIILGQGLAKKLKAGVGSTLFMVSYDKYGSMGSVNFTVTDINKYATDAENDGKIIMTTANAVNLLALSDEVTEICIKVKERNQVDSIASQLKAKYGAKYNIEVYPWQDLMGSYAQTIGMFDSVQFIILLIMAIVVMIGVINTILMSVFERTSEIGTLMALGSSKKRIIALFMAESFWIGTIGGIIGAIVGLIIVSLANISGIPFASPGTTQVFYIKPILNPGIVITPPVFLIFVSILAGIYPARFAAKLNPVEAIRKA